MSTVLVKLGLLAGAAVLGFGAGWGVNGWRLGAQMSEQASQHAQAVTRSFEAGKVEQARLQALKDAQTAAVSVIDVDELAKLRKAQDENKTLRARVASGAVGLRVAASCPPSRGDLPPPGPAAGVDSEPGPVLSPAAGQDYFALRDNITLTERTLAACQRAGRVLTAPTVPTQP